MSQYIYGPMEGATSSANGVSGLVPRPASGDQNKVLKGDGTWGTIIDDTSGEGDTESTWSADKITAELTAADLNEVQEIIDSYDNEEDESMVVQMEYTPGGGYMSVIDAADIAEAMMAGKYVVLHFVQIDNNIPAAYVPLAYYAPGSNYGSTIEGFSLAKHDQIGSRVHDLPIQLNTPYIQNGKLAVDFAD